jgi:hypothetical protein
MSQSEYYLIDKQKSPNLDNFTHGLKVIVENSEYDIKSSTFGEGI